MNGGLTSFSLPSHRLANKQDVQGALDEIDICEHLDLEETVNMNKCPCRVVSLLFCAISLGSALSCLF